MQDIYLYLWSGSDVLRNWSSGVAAVLAASELEAWEKLKLADPSAFYYLMHGCSAWVDSEENYQFWLEDRYEGDDTREAILPVRYDLKDAPAIVQWGSS